MVDDKKDSKISLSEEETVKAPPCPQCQGETDLIVTRDGRNLYLCPTCDAKVRKQILSELGQEEKSDDKKE